MDFSSRDDPFKILGIKNSADTVEAKEAYLKRIKECHPDLGGSEEEAKIVNAAYAFIKEHTGYSRKTNKGASTRKEQDVKSSFYEEWMKELNDLYNDIYSKPSESSRGRQKANNTQTRNRQEESKYGDSRQRQSVDHVNGSKGEQKTATSQASHAHVHPENDTSIKRSLKRFISKNCDYYELHEAIRLANLYGPRLLKSRRVAGIGLIVSLNFLVKTIIEVTVRGQFNSSRLSVILMCTYASMCWLWFSVSLNRK